MNALKNLQYLCPNCFEQRSWNEVLFRRSIIKKIPDLEQCRLLLRINPKTRLPQKSFAIADWRQYPEQNRVVSNGVIAELKDYNGEILNKKICPKCHYPLLNLEEPMAYLLSWGKNGVEFEYGETFVKSIGESEVWCINEQEKSDWENAITYQNIIFLNGGIIRFPVGLKYSDAIFSRILVERLTWRANEALVWLNLDEIQESVYTVQAYAASAGASDFRLERPTVYMVETGNRLITDISDFQKAMEESAGSLLNIIQVLSGRYARILPWNEVCCKESARQAVEWFFKMLAEEKEFEEDKADLENVLSEDVVSVETLLEKEGWEE